MTIPIILAGGMGTRLQPLSTPDNPKQFLTLFNDLSLFQITIKRIRQWLPTQPLLLLCQAAHEMLAQEQLQQIDPTGQHIFIFEPSVQNTAASIATASHYCQQHFPKETLVFIPSDQYLLSSEQWLMDMKKITQHIDPSLLTLLGVTPSSAHSGFGYIQKGGALNYGFNVDAYLEKPAPALAETFFNDPSYYWSCGTFLGLAKTFLEAFAQLNPTLTTQCKQALELATHHDQQVLLDKVSYEKCLAKSFDYEIVENHRPLAVAELTSGWLDIGTLEGLNEALEHFQHSAKKA
jgi:mannose-1-phosphate guanylyltransferase